MTDRQQFAPRHEVFADNSQEEVVAQQGFRVRPVQDEKGKPGVWMTERQLFAPRHEVFDNNSQEEVVARQGFRSRPLRDGGREPSPGRTWPMRRADAPLAAMGAQFVKHVQAHRLDEP